MMKCPKCQFENPQGQKFCGECGTRLLSSEKPVAGTVTLAAPAGKLSLGSVFARRYQIIEELGRGGMGRLYRALDLKLHASWLEGGSSPLPMVLWSPTTGVASSPAGTRVCRISTGRSLKRRRAAG